MKAQGLFVLARRWASPWCSRCSAAHAGFRKMLLEEYLFEPMVDPSLTDIGARFFGSLFSFSAGGAIGIFAPP